MNCNVRNANVDDNRCCCRKVRTLSRINLGIVIVNRFRGANTLAYVCKFSVGLVRSCPMIDYEILVSSHSSPYNSFGGKLSPTSPVVPAIR